MQWKNPKGGGRWARRLERWATYGLRPASRLGPRLPRPLVHQLSQRIFEATLLINPAPKAAIRSNLARVLDASPDSREVLRASREMRRNFGRSWGDLLHLPGRPEDEIQGLLEHVEGDEWLRQAAERGKGVIMITAHLGSWEVGGLFLSSMELPLSVVYVKDQFPVAEEIRGLMRRHQDVEEIPIRLDTGLSSLPILRALRDGRVVAMQGDRDFNDSGVWLDFFGVPAPFPQGPFMLAAMTGAVLVPTFVAYSPSYRFEICIEEPIRVPTGGTRATAVRAAMGQWVEVLEQAVARWPTQWYTFFDFWAASPPAAEPQEAVG